MIFQYQKIKNGKYRFEVIANYYVELPLFQGMNLNIVQPYYEIQTYGSRVFLLLRKGYQWNGTGRTGWWPTPKCTARASAAHDCLYQCLELSLLPQIRKMESDLTFYNFAIEDKEWKCIADFYYNVLKYCGSGACKPVKEKP
jgi:hypothetical protein